MSMRKQTQLADLILGSGLVGDGGKRQAEKVDNSRPQSAAADGPALYQFGAGRTARRPQSSSTPKTAAAPTSREWSGRSQPRVAAGHLQPEPDRHVASNSSSSSRTGQLPHRSSAPHGSHGSHHYHVQTLAWDDTAGDVTSVSSAHMQDVAANEGVGNLQGGGSVGRGGGGREEQEGVPGRWTEQAWPGGVGVDGCGGGGTQGGEVLEEEEVHGTATAPAWQQQQQPVNAAWDDCIPTAMSGERAVTGSGEGLPPARDRRNLEHSISEGRRSHVSHVGGRTIGPQTVLSRPGSRELPAVHDTASVAGASRNSRASSRDGGAIPTHQPQDAGASMEAAATQIAAASAAVAEAQRRHLESKVSQLESKVDQLQTELVSCQRSLQLAQAQMLEAAQKSEKDKVDIGMKHLKAVKLAEAGQDRAETGRRAAERRAAAAENDLLHVKTALAHQEAETVKVQQSLQATLDTVQVCHRSQVTALETTINNLREELVTVQARRQSEMDNEKKALQESLEKARQDVARRTQTILNLNADCETLQKSKAHLEESKAELEQSQADLQIIITNLRNQLHQQTHELAATATANTACHEFGSAGMIQPQASISSSKPPTGIISGCVGPGSRTASAGRGRSSGSGNGLRCSMDGNAGCRDVSVQQELQMELAKMREQYAQRLQSVEEVVDKAEATVKEATSNCNLLFQLLVDRTAHLLAGRLTILPAQITTQGNTPTGNNNNNNNNLLATSIATTLFSQVYLMPEASSASQSSGLTQKPPTPIKRASAAAAAAGNDKLALLYLMNDKLSTENAALLAELAKFHAGKHPLLRRNSLTVLGAPATTPPTTSATQSIASKPTAMPPAPSGSTATGAQGATLRRSFSDAAPPAGFSAGGGGGGVPANSAAKAALSQAIKEVLLCSRQQLLPAMMTGEGWDAASAAADGASAGTRGRAGSGSLANVAMSTQMSSKAEMAVSVTEQLASIRAAHVLLQSEVVGLTAQLLAMQKEEGNKAAVQAAHKSAFAQVQGELFLAQKRISDLEEQLRNARSHSHSTSSPSWESQASSERDVEERVRGARDEAQRQRNAAASAQRDKEVVEHQLEEQQIAVRRAEQQLRDERIELHKQEEAVKRLRALLAQARSLLKNAGIPFMEDDAFPVDGSQGGKGSRQSSACGEPGSLFKAVDAREKEKEVQRARAEAMDWMTKSNTANKELKTLRGQLIKKEADHKQALEAAQLATVDEIARLKQDVSTVTQARKQAERAASEVAGDLSDARRTIKDLTSQLEKMKIDTEYLRQRATQLKNQRPRLTFAPTLSMGISAEQAKPP